MTTLRDAVEALEALAPASYAAEWDNVGLLLEPVHKEHAPAERIFLTVDCTEAVVREAIAWKAELIVAYHPPVFHGLKTITQAIPRQRALLDLIRRTGDR